MSGARPGGAGPLPAALLVAGIWAVILGWTPALRSFGAFKEAALLGLVGGAMLAWSLEREAPAVGGRPLVALSLLLGGAALHPSPEGLLAAGHLSALVGVGLLAASRRWGARAWAWVVGLPLGLDLALSLVQGLDLAVPAASRASFGGTHGLLVGAIGNPNENAWTLLLGALLLWELLGPRSGAPAAALALVVVALDRSRMAAVAAVAVIPWAAGLRGRWWAAALALGGAAAWSWGAGEALVGRLWLAKIHLGMVVGRWGLPAGAGAWARDFPEAQAAALAMGPGWPSALDHAHMDAAEVLYEYGAVAILIGWLLWRPARGRPLALAVGALLGLTGYPLFSPAPALVLALAWGLGGASPVAEGGRLSRGAMGLAGALLLVLGVLHYRSERAIVAALEAPALASATLEAAPLPTGPVRYYQGLAALLAGDIPLARARLEAAWAARHRPEVARALAQVSAVAGEPERAARWEAEAVRLEGGR
ncbi:MAG: hypothetical protein JXX28_13075 [Deltaproteobacteria bacterium]|nr:hypothetical protein [Deltaproteobacteria bacterium]